VSQEIVLFTAVFGQPDVLFDPMLPLPEVEKICFTDLEFMGQSRYRMVQVDLDELPPAKRNRRVKIFWPEIFDSYDYSLYVDSTAEVLADPRDLIQYLEPGSDIAMFRAAQRDCLYREAIECVRLGLDDPGLIRQQVAKYRGEGLLPPTGLWAGTAILRRHTPAMREFAQVWWREVEQFSCRDQISLPYVIWKTGARVSILPGSIFANEFVAWQPWVRREERFRGLWRG
jgi:hypothetical protein